MDMSTASSKSMAFSVLSNVRWYQDFDFYSVRSIRLPFSFSPLGAQQLRIAATEMTRPEIVSISRSGMLSQGIRSSLIVDAGAFECS